MMAVGDQCFEYKVGYNPLTVRFAVCDNRVVGTIGSFSRPYFCQ